MKPNCCFPNKLEDIDVLELASKLEAGCPKAHYYIGNLWYDKRQYDKAKNAWEKAAELDPEFSNSIFAICHWFTTISIRNLKKQEKPWNVHFFLGYDRQQGISGTGSAA